MTYEFVMRLPRSGEQLPLGFDDQRGAPELSSHVAYTQRRRAVALRTGAIFILAGVIFLLAGGLYFVLFVLSTVVEEIDPELESLAAIDKYYSDPLDLLAQGQHWLSVPHEFSTSSDPLQSQLLVFSKDGSFGIAAPGRAAGERKPILVTTDWGRTWVRTDLEFPQGHWLGTVEFGSDARSALALSQRGAVFGTRDRGASWARLRDLTMLDGDSVTNSWSKAKQGGVVALGHMGTIQSTSDWGDTWHTPKWAKTLVDDAVGGSPISEAVFSADGATGVVGRYKGYAEASSQKGSIRVKTENTECWYELHERSQEFRNTEWLNAAAFTADGERGVLAGVSGTLLVSDNGGKSWKEPTGIDVAPGRGEGWVAVALAEDAMNGVLLSNKGSVFVTANGGDSWSSKDPLSLRKGESVYETDTVAFSADAMHGVAVGNRGSVLVTVDGGDLWNITERFDSDYDIRVVASVPPEHEGEPYSAVALDAGGNLYLLERHDDLKGWRDLSSSELHERLRASPVIRNSAFLKNLEAQILRAPAGAPGGGKPPDPRGLGDGLKGFDAILNTLTLLRVFTLMVLLLLVALLVRLYQYNLRMAAFWDSRSDAVLLANRLMHCDTKSFGELVSALSPDTYDFKPGPRSGPQSTASPTSPTQREFCRFSLFSTTQVIELLNLCTPNSPQYCL